MRIISGEKRGLKLITLESNDTRPTLDRVKESLFNILQSKQIVYEDILDLFAGSGALGLETLSRGAQNVILCDKSKQACDVIRQNIERAGYIDKCKILNKDYIECVTEVSKQKFDVIFLDPPYNMGLGIKAIEEISKYNMLKQDGIIVLETSDLEDIPDKIGIFENIDIRKYGKVKVYLFK